MTKILVASGNPAKIEAAQRGFQQLFTNETLVIEGQATPSGVSDQPMGDEETYRGAYNRAKRLKEVRPDADYWIGIEGGNIRHTATEMEVMAWIVVLGQTYESKARTAGYYLPPRVIELVNQGYELGEADDIIFGVSNSKHSLGSSGLLTDGVIDRINFYMPAVIFAFLPFYKPELYQIKKG
ncbi:MAG: inosine/xanthosine triphosphatase [Bacteroidota bacterium]